MRKDRQAILSLVAMGRITACEAERLLIASNDGREWFWLAAIVGLAYFAQAHGNLDFSGLWHMAQRILDAAQHGLQTAVWMLGNGTGGRV